MLNESSPPDDPGTIYQEVSQAATFDDDSVIGLKVRVEV